MRRGGHKGWEHRMTGRQGKERVYIAGTGDMRYIVTGIAYVADLVSEMLYKSGVVDRRRFLW